MNKHSACIVTTCTFSAVQANAHPSAKSGSKVTLFSLVRSVGVICILGFIAGCGGGEDAAGNSSTILAPSVSNIISEPSVLNQNPEPDLARPSLNFEVKKMVLSWPSQLSATFYQVNEFIDGTLHSVKETTESAMKLPVSLYEIFNARYEVKPCIIDVGGNKICNGEVLNIAVENKLELMRKNGIGYVRPPLDDGEILFGQSLAVSEDGTTLAVTSDSLEINNVAQPRSVRIYVQNNKRDWEFVQQLSTNDSVSEFGAGLALSKDGNVLVVGAPQINSNSLLSAVFVYVRENGTWQLKQTLIPRFPKISGAFGESVAVSGDGNTIVVGDRSDNNFISGVHTNPPFTGLLGGAQSSLGAADVFSRGAGVWTEQAYIKPTFVNADHVQDNYNFGKKVGISSDGSTLAIYSLGSVRQASSGNMQRSPGSVALFTRNFDEWTFREELISNAAGNLGLGPSFSLSGDGKLLAISGSSFTTADSGDAGSSIGLFRFDGNNWVLSHVLRPTSSALNKLTTSGTVVSLSVDGTTLAVGNPVDSSAANGLEGNKKVELQNDLTSPGSGAAYVFKFADSSWKQKAYIKSANTLPGASFGSTLALSGTGLLAVGASKDRCTSGAVNPVITLNCGAVYLY